jgi:hypothetical protein
MEIPHMRALKQKGPRWRVCQRGWKGSSPDWVGSRAALSIVDMVCGECATTAPYMEAKTCVVHPTFGGDRGAAIFGR